MCFCVTLGIKLKKLVGLGRHTKDASIKVGINLGTVGLEVAGGGGIRVEREEKIE